jgi:hypothetical protein
MTELSIMLVLLDCKRRRSNSLRHVTYLSAFECFGFHFGGLMSANKLGDGNGMVNQTIELRQDYDNEGIGTCLESLIGGNHFR